MNPGRATLNWSSLQVDSTAEKTPCPFVPFIFLLADIPGARKQLAAAKNELLSAGNAAGSPNWTTTFPLSGGRCRWLEQKANSMSRPGRYSVRALLLAALVK